MIRSLSPSFGAAALSSFTIFPVVGLSVLPMTATVDARGTHSCNNSSHFPPDAFPDGEGESRKVSAGPSQALGKPRSHWIPHHRIDDRDGGSSFLGGQTGGSGVRHQDVRAARDGFIHQ